MTSKLVLPLVCLILSAILSQAVDQPKQSKKPRLFFVTTSLTTTTSQTTSTLFATTICYTFNAGTNTCPARRRRMLVSEDPISKVEESIDPFKTERATGERDEVDGGLQRNGDLINPRARRPKTVFGTQISSSYGIGAIGWYYLTTTSTTTSTSISTLTSFTLTAQLSVECTPNGFTPVACGK